ncbi:hypothetical protein GF358_01330 [Candidatus Woesearchaeota archaeon]|nr:hypothetical protein [Candidatus Woesearchaeota archaeon]
MDRQEIIILFIVAILAVIGLVLMYKNIDATGEATYPQLQRTNVIGCNTNADCYWALNSLDYECRVGLCRPKNAIGPPQYAPKLKIR